jgi:hypothetical protein
MLGRYSGRQVLSRMLPPAAAGNQPTTNSGPSTTHLVHSVSGLVGSRRRQSRRAGQGHRDAYRSGLAGRARRAHQANRQGPPVRPRPPGTRSITRRLAPSTRPTARMATPSAVTCTSSPGRALLMRRRRRRFIRSVSVVFMAATAPMTTASSSRWVRFGLESFPPAAPVAAVEERPTALEGESDLSVPADGECEHGSGPEGSTGARERLIAAHCVERC